MAKLALEDAPKKVRDLFDKGFAAMERDNLDYAIDMFIAALDAEPRLFQARKFLRAAEVKKFKKSGGGAIQHFASTLVGLPGLIAGYTQLKNKPEQALHTAEKLLRSDPLNLTFIDFSDKAAMAANLPEVSVLNLEVAREAYPDNNTVLRRLGELYVSIEQHREARQCFEELVRRLPNDQSAIKALKDAAALDTMQKGGWTEAESFRDIIRDTKEAVQLERESKAVKTGSDIEELILETQAKIEREPENINYKRALADLYARSEQFDKAIEVLQVAADASGRADPQIDRMLSTVRVRQFDHDIAQLEAQNDAAGAEARRQAKDVFLLEDATDRVRRYPNDLQFRYELGVLLYERNQLNEAIQEFQLASRNPQRRIRALYYLGLCFKQKAQLDLALEQLEKAAAELNLMDDTKKDIVYEMGSICELMGNAAQALEHYKAIYAVDIRFKDVAQKIEQAYKK